MPLPLPLQSLVGTRRFWTDFIWDTWVGIDGYPQLEHCTVRFSVAPGYALTLSLDDSLSYFSLGLESPGQEPVEIAWDDQAHWHPHVLRWQELELICRAVALQDPTLPHPGVPLLLLHRFAPICVGDDLESILPMLAAAWGDLGVFSRSEIRDFIERNVVRDAGFEWRYDDELGAWILEQQDRRAWKALYTLRSPDNLEFPFAALDRLVREAQSTHEQVRGAAHDEAATFAATGALTQIPAMVQALRAEKQEPLARMLEVSSTAGACWVAEALLGLAPGSLVRQHSQGIIEPRAKHLLALTLPLNDPDRPLPETAAKFFNDSLNRVLTDRLIGSSDASSSCRGHWDCFHVLIKNDLEYGITLLREFLWWAQAPETVQLNVYQGEEIHLELNRDPGTVEELSLQFGQVVEMEWELFGEPGHRFDRVPFHPATRDVLRRVLREVGAEGPDEDGWYALDLPDGGSLQLCLRRMDDDPDLDGGTAVVRRLTLGVTELLHRFLAAGHLLLLPMAIATSPVDGQMITESWPPVTVVRTAFELHEILEGGPYPWWRKAGG